MPQTMKSGEVRTCAVIPSCMRNAASNGRRYEPCHNTEGPHATRLCSSEYYPFLSCIKFPIKFRPMFNIPKNIYLEKTVHFFTFLT